MLRRIPSHICNLLGVRTAVGVLVAVNDPCTGSVDSVEVETSVETCSEESDAEVAGSDAFEQDKFTTL